MHDPALQLAIFGRMALVAATGVLAGVGFYLTAILATAVTMLILELEFMPLIGPLPHRMAPGSPDGPDAPPGPELE